MIFLSRVVISAISENMKGIIAIVRIAIGTTLAILVDLAKNLDNPHNVPDLKVAHTRNLLVRQHQKNGSHVIVTKR